MKKAITMLALVAVMGICNSAYAIEWHAWGVHGGTATITGEGAISASVHDTAGQTPDYHWNKSSWTTRTGQKAFVSTSAFNGMTLDAAIQSLSYTGQTATNWSNVYWNIVIQDSGGKKAIVSPAYNSASSTGFATDGSAGTGKDYCIFEAESGWSGTTSTGWYAAEWADIKNLTIASGPFTEFPDTLTGTATMENDPVYSVTNWAAWATNSGAVSAQNDGFLFVFGQSTAQNADIQLMSVGVNGVLVPEPATMILLGLGGLLVRKIKRA